MLVQITFAVIIAAAAVALIIQLQRGRRPKALSAQQSAQFEEGTLTVTGVSDRPAKADAKGEVFATISGTIVGPGTSPTDVYTTVVLNLANDRWPRPGDDLPVLYKPGKVDTSWRLGTLPPP
ncbi:hypothetical protein HH308_11715 [Gordonia sp. TBRC 11910]|uniref:Uncharacterized protein n=1 Tax=Gordonia asplenii TaxID=2725283 RepID=A0A848KV13_9ACTN|nr:hypothetical protein [Gordonia asplenii]NMO01877.1 hypothetical protein [Gordonia asplenii]